MRGSTTTLSVHIRKTLLFLHTVHLHHNLVMFVCACDAGLPLFSAVEQLPHQPPRAVVTETTVCPPPAAAQARVSLPHLFNGPVLTE